MSHLLRPLLRLLPLSAAAATAGLSQHIIYVVDTVVNMIFDRNLQCMDIQNMVPGFVKGSELRREIYNGEVWKLNSEVAAEGSVLVE